MSNYEVMHLKEVRDILETLEKTLAQYQTDSDAADAAYQECVALKTHCDEVEMYDVKKDEPITDEGYAKLLIEQRAHKARRTQLNKQIAEMQLNMSRVNKDLRRRAHIAGGILPEVPKELTPKEAFVKRMAPYNWGDTHDRLEKVGKAGKESIIDDVAADILIAYYDKKK